MLDKTWTGLSSKTLTSDTGIGKSCLIKAIVQICEDIVHVDPVLAEVPFGRSGRTTSATSSFYTLSSRAESERTKKITEVYASTKPYPHWWSEHEDSKILRKRKSGTGATEAVLERNICFVDTPGYGSGTSVYTPRDFHKVRTLTRYSSLPNVLSRLFVMWRCRWKRHLLFLARARAIYYLYFQELGLHRWILCFT